MEVRQRRGEADPHRVVELRPRGKTPTEHREWLLGQLVDLAEQRDNLNVAFKAVEFLSRSYRLQEKMAEREEASLDASPEGMDLDRARRIREAARVA
jgi:hypothetical protein